jgi:hypothetical protein
MRERLQQAWAKRMERVACRAPGDDPTPVLEAMGQLVVWHLVEHLEGTDTAPERGNDARSGRVSFGRHRTATGAARRQPTPRRVYERLPARELRVLRSAADEALAETRIRAERDGEDRSAWLDALALGELGRSILREGAPSRALLARAPGDLRRPSPRRLASMLDGRLDGLSAACCAVWCLRNDAQEARTLWWARKGSSRPPLRVAASDPEPIRAPDEGTFLAVHEAASLEAVWFATSRELAVYSGENHFLTLTAPGLVTEDARPGYWLGRVSAGLVGDLDVEVKWGDGYFDWRLRIPH